MRKNKKEVLNELASYEHEKWSECQKKIHAKCKQKDNGTLEILKKELENMQECIYSYQKTNQEYKEDVKKAIIKTYDIMKENDIIKEIKISNKELIEELQNIEHGRRNRWIKYMISCCIKNESTYVIPKEKVLLWESEIETEYKDLNKKQKESDLKEVYNIFSRLNNKNKENDHER